MSPAGAAPQSARGTPNHQRRGIATERWSCPSDPANSGRACARVHHDLEHSRKEQHATSEQRIGVTDRLNFSPASRTERTSAGYMETVDLACAVSVRSVARFVMWVRDRRAGWTGIELNARSTLVPEQSPRSRRTECAIARARLQPPASPLQGVARAGVWSRSLVGRVAAAPELAATRRPLRDAKRPLTEDCDVHPRDCVPLHTCVCACSRSMAQQTATTAVGLELGGDDDVDGTKAPMSSARRCGSFTRSGENASVCKPTGCCWRVVRGFGGHGRTSRDLLVDALRPGWLVCPSPPRRSVALAAARRQGMPLGGSLALGPVGPSLTAPRRARLCSEEGLGGE